MDLFIIILIIIFGFIFLGFFISKRLSDISNKQKPGDEIFQIIRLLQEGGEKDRKVLLTTLSENTRSLNQRLDAAARVIGDVQRNVGEMSEIGRGIKELQDFLKSPKIRGNIGEQVLKDLISQMFPKSSFFLQHSFKSGEKVDAAIKTSAGILPIDSKFPMENFQKMAKEESEESRSLYKRQFLRDIEKHIKDISKKYILPEEGTMDFALMYIPSEAVYYEIVNTPEILTMAQERRVYPVSPTTLYAHLQTILLSFEGQRFESRAKEIVALLRAIKIDYAKTYEDVSVLQKHLNNASNMMSSVLTGFNRLGQKIQSSQNLEEKIDKQQKSSLSS